MTATASRLEKNPGANLGHRFTLGTVPWNGSENRSGNPSGTRLHFHQPFVPVTQSPRVSRHLRKRDLAHGNVIFGHVANFVAHVMMSQVMALQILLLHLQASESERRIISSIRRRIRKFRRTQYRRRLLTHLLLANIVLISTHVYRSIWQQER